MLSASPTYPFILNASNQIILNNTSIGATTPSTGTFTTLTASLGAHFGSLFGTSTTDLSKHLDLYGGVYGLSITGGRLNSVVSSGGSFFWVIAGSDVGNITSTGLNSTAVGATTASTGAFTTLSATSTVSGAGFTALHAAPGPIGSTTASTGKFTTLTTVVTALTYSSTIATNCSLGGIFTVTLTGAATLSNPTSLVAGMEYKWIVTQDATGSRVLSFGTVFKWANKTAGVLTTTASAVDMITGFSPDGTNLYCVLTSNIG